MSVSKCLSCSHVQCREKKLLHNIRMVDGLVQFVCVCVIDAYRVYGTTIESNNRLSSTKYVYDKCYLNVSLPSNGLDETHYTKTHSPSLPLGCATKLQNGACKVIKYCVRNTFCVSVCASSSIVHFECCTNNIQMHSM